MLLFVFKQFQIKILLTLFRHTSPPSMDDLDDKNSFIKEADKQIIYKSELIDSQSNAVHSYDSFPPTMNEEFLESSDATDPDADDYCPSSSIIEPQEYSISNLHEEPQNILKKRRRIVSLNNEGDNSTDDDKDNIPNLHCLPRSPSPTFPAVASNSEIPDITPETIALISKNDRPGPISKKASTQLIKELQTRALLQSAVVIPAALDPKRRKVRILQSDDDESINVDDIGAPFDEQLDIKEEEDGDMCTALELKVEKFNYEEEGENDATKPAKDPLIENVERSSIMNGHRDSGNSSDGGGFHQTGTSKGAQSSKNQ